MSEYTRLIKSLLGDMSPDQMTALLSGATPEPTASGYKIAKRHGIALVESRLSAWCSAVRTGTAIRHTQPDSDLFSE